MRSRRKFIRQSLVGAMSVGAISGRVSAKAASAGGSKPIVVSTWDFGVAANQAAWEVLKGKGRALDAVERGVRVAEADLANPTVGKGGYRWMPASWTRRATAVRWRRWSILRIPFRSPDW